MTNLDYDHRFYVGPLGRLRALPDVDGSVDTPLTLIGGVHVSLTGYTIRDTFGIKRQWSWNYPSLTPAQARWVEALHRDIVAGPLYLIDPRRPNRLPEQIATGGSQLRTTDGVIPSNLAVCNWRPFSYITGADHTTLPAFEYLRGGYELQRLADGSSLFELAGPGSDGRLNVPVRPGETPEVSGWTVGQAGASTTVTVQVFNLAGGLMSATTSTPVPVSASTWASVSVTAPTVPPAGAYLRVRVDVDADAAGSTFLTALQVREPGPIMPGELEVFCPDPDSDLDWWLGGGACQVVVDVGASSYLRPGLSAAALTLVERTYGTRGSTSGQQPVITPEVDSTRLPFDKNTSPWRLGIAEDATFAAANDPRNTAMHATGVDGSGQAWVNADTYSHPISYASETDPLATVTDNVSQYTSWQERIPATARIAAGDDKHMHVITPDRTKVQEHFGVTRNSPTSYDVARRAEIPLNGPGIGPQQGCRAYGGPAIGGLIRAWEVDPTDPRYTGEIRHALACALRGNQLFMNTATWDNQFGYYSSGTLDPAKYPGWPAGTPAAGFMRQTGYVWPASEQDYYSPYNYSGVIPMGSYFAIPSGVDVNTLDLQSPQGKMLARAAQNYGVYVTDTSGVQSFYVEDDGGGPASAFALAVIGGTSYSGHDARVVFNALRVVTGNTATTPNGGPLGAPRRG